jgi:hypothetical protein
MSLYYKKKSQKKAEGYEIEHFMLENLCSMDVIPGSTGNFLHIVPQESEMDITNWITGAPCTMPSNKTL